MMVLQLSESFNCLATELCLATTVQRFHWTLGALHLFLLLVLVVLVLLLLLLVVVVVVVILLLPGNYSATFSLDAWCTASLLLHLPHFLKCTGYQRCTVPVLRRSIRFPPHNIFSFSGFFGFAKSVLVVESQLCDSSSDCLRWLLTDSRETPPSNCTPLALDGLVTPGTPPLMLSIQTHCTPPPHYRWVGYSLRGALLHQIRSFFEHCSKSL